jgi:hypothetical protein
VRGAARALAVAGVLALASAAAAGPASEPWRAEFDAVCGKTQDAMALSTEELKALVVRADRLLPEIEKLDPTRRKVYAQRLKSCRNLYQFVVESREAERPEGPK